jgi:hypothetical protein
MLRPNNDGADAYLIEGRAERIEVAVEKLVWAALEENLACLRVDVEPSRIEQHDPFTRNHESESQPALVRSCQRSTSTTQRVEWSSRRGGSTLPG